MGSFIFTLLDNDNNSYFVRGNNPLALYKFKAGFYIYASTELILDSALFTLGIFDLEHEEIETHIGDILKIDKDGNLSRSTFDVPNDEYCYFRSFDYSRLYNGESKDVWRLKNFTSTLGIASEDIDLLLEYGYDPDEIQDLLHYPNAFQEAVCAAYDGF